jgi:hypothetical protein
MIIASFIGVIVFSGMSIEILYLAFMWIIGDRQYVNDMLW